MRRRHAETADASLRLSGAAEVTDAQVVAKIDAARVNEQAVETEVAAIGPGRDAAVARIATAGRASGDKRRLGRGLGGGPRL